MCDNCEALIRGVRTLCLECGTTDTLDLCDSPACLRAVVYIKDKNGDTAMDLLQPQDEELKRFIRKTQAQNSVSRGDIADDDGKDTSFRFVNYRLLTFTKDDEGSAGSGSESE